MSEKMQVGIAVGCGFIVFVFSYIKVFLYGKSRKQRFIEKAKEKGNVTYGTCVDTKLSLGTDKAGSPDALRFDTLIVKYEYVVNGKKYYKKLRFQSPGMASIDFPYKVKVYYDPKRPRKAVCKREASVGRQRQNGCLLTILYTIATTRIVYEIIKRFV